MDQLDKARILEFRGGDLHDRDGERIGKLEEVYLGAESGEPEWALVHTGMSGTKRAFVPLRDASESDGRLRVPHAKGTVEDTPQVEPDGRLSPGEEAELYRRYGLEQPPAEA